MQSHYQILGIPCDAEPETIRKAYRQLARECHPDMTDGSQERMVELNLAYEVLKDPQAREAYDRSLAPPKKKPEKPVSYADPLLFLMHLFKPLDDSIQRSLQGLGMAYEELAYDLYDDRYLAPFEQAFQTLGTSIEQAFRALRTAEWPECYRTAIHLYQQGLRHFEDALEDFTTFLGNYDSDLLVEGHEFILAGSEILDEARAAMGIRC